MCIWTKQSLSSRVCSAHWIGIIVQHYDAAVALQGRLMDQLSSARGASKLANKCATKQGSQQIAPTALVKMLFYVTLSCAILCSALLCGAVLCCAVLCCAVPLNTTYVSKRPCILLKGNNVSRCQMLVVGCPGTSGEVQWHLCVSEY